MTEKFFCSLASDAFGEDLHGTASNTQGFLLMEYSKPFPGKINAESISEPWLGGAQQFAKNNKWKFLLVKNQDSNPQRKMMRVNAWEASTAVDNFDPEQAFQQKNSLSQEAVKDDFFLVCTNGKKDKCCSKFGLPLYEYLVANGINVWQCSHVGGDRFAGNILWLPYGIYYGRVKVQDLGRIMENCRNKMITPEYYRGRCIYSSAQQSAEYFLRSHLQDFSVLSDISFQHTETLDDQVNVIAVTHEKTFDVLMKKQVIHYPNLLTCTSKAPEDIVKHKLVSITARQ